MSMNTDSRKEMVKKYLDKSNRTWDEAVAARNLKMWPMAANRMYYSLINAMRALLLVDQHNAHTHAGMKSAIGQYYVLTNELTAEEGKLYSQMETMRERADYDCYFEATETDVEEKFIPVKGLIDKITQMVFSRQID